MPSKKNALEIGRLYIHKEALGRRLTRLFLYVPTKLTHQKRDMAYDAPTFSGALPRSRHIWTEYYEYKTIFKYDEYDRGKIETAGTLRNQEIITESVLAEDSPYIVFDSIFTLT